MVLTPNVINKCIFQLRESCRQINALTRLNMHLFITFGITLFLITTSLYGGNYEEGIATISAAIREEKLNEALHTFLIEGNSGAAAAALFNLEYYPLAIWMDAKALHQYPWNWQAQKNWEESLKKLNIQQTVTFYIWQKRLVRISVGLFIFALFSVLYLWTSRKTVGIIACSALLLAFYAQYLSPPYGVIIKSSALYQQKNTHSFLAYTKPLPAGLLVRLLDVDQEWAKVQILEERKVGYMLAEDLRFVLNN